MKLLIITNLFPNAAEPRRGLFNRQQAAELATRCDVTVVAPVVWTPRSAVPRQERIDGLDVHHPRYLVIPWLSRPINWLLLSWGLQRTVRRLHQQRRFDRLLATWAYPDVVAASRLARALKIPLVAKLHGSDINELAAGPWRRRLVAGALQRAARVIAVSSPLKAKTEALGVPAERIDVISNGVDAGLFAPRDKAACRRQLGLPVDGPLILFVGNLVPVKGLDDLLEAVRRAHAREGAKPFTLAVVGDGPLRAELQRRAQSVWLRGRVVLAGAKPHEEIPVWLGACDALCLPSLNEGCPNVVIEALASGRPVVGTRTGGIPELVLDGETGVLVPVCDPDGLALGLLKALTTAWDPERIRRSAVGRGWGANAEAMFQALEAAGTQMTVLHVLRYSIPNMSGYTVRSQAVIEGQRALGVRPVVVTSARHEAGAARELLNGIPYYRCQPSSNPFVRWLQTRPPLVRDVATMAQLYDRILRVARREGAQLIHAHSPVFCGLPVLAAARRLRCPVVYEVRALWEDAAVDQEKTAEGGLFYALMRRLETFVLNGVDRIIVICEGLKRDIIQRGIPAARIVVVPNGVHVESFSPMAAPLHLLKRHGTNGHRVIGFIGSFFRFEGLETLLEAVPALRARDPSIMVLVVGDGEHGASLKRLAADRGLLDSAVVFTGRVPHDDVPGYYAAMDVLVYPRISRRITELVTPLKPLEAMALGKAVVASDVGGLRELVEDQATGLLFRAGDPADLAEKCLRLLGDPALARRLGKGARRFVERERDWKPICQKPVALYRELVG